MVVRDGDRDSTLSVSDVLELLDAVVAESDAPDVPTTVGTGLAADEVAAIEGRVRDVRASLARWRRRGQELSALFSSAHELAELRDTDALLDRLVERAHDLLGTDVTYLSEFHEGNDELRVRSTSGAVDSSFRELRVPPGMGLASRVVQTRSPQWTSTYQQNDDIPHEPGIDAAVAAEGLVALLGVPMIAGDRVLGVLFAANRSGHSFAPDEVALLSAFANHAAVVLQTTSLLEQARLAAHEADRARAVLAENVTAMERASAVHEDLTAVVLKGGSAQGLADTLSDALNRAVTILDRDRVPVAQAPGSEAGLLHGGDVPSTRVRRAVEESRPSGRCVFVEGAPTEPEVVVAVVAGDVFLGAVLVGHGELELGAVEQRTIERTAQIAALVAVQQDAVAEAEDRVRGELVSDILRGDGMQRRDLARRARARDVWLDELCTVVVVAVPAEARRAVAVAVRRSGPAALVGERDGVLAVLSPGSEPNDVAREVWAVARRAVESPVLAVAGPPAPSPAELGASFETARRCAQLLQHRAVPEGAVDAQAYEPYLAVFGSGSRDLSRFIDSVIGPVLRWDAERGTELFATLAAFADSHASPTRTARALHVHINTVTQRLERITALLGDDWREPEPLFRVSLAARMHALVGGRATGGPVDAG
ncbi:GAF domain-containing protein [Prauserella isguenensis]|uniref:GAF domain-containing protein n=1 Tax=Prauserella isguenensis TaxID=1470180 RepID=A0A839RXR3_9PSEU|nr:GAF domain-containing protein [Prauserella isguenensis]MBB3049942.1 GAF domain-containing protein [Prauserella isguenensis]